MTDRGQPVSAIRSGWSPRPVPPAVPRHQALARQPGLPRCRPMPVPASAARPWRSCAMTGTSTGSGHGCLGIPRQSASIRHLARWFGAALACGLVWRGRIFRSFMPG